MRSKSLTRSLMLAGALAAGGAAYAADATPTFDVPQRAGEASTMTDGRPNLVTNNPWYLEEHDVVRMDAVPLGADVHLTVPETVTHSHVVVHPPVAHAYVVMPHPLGDATDATPTYDVPSRAGEASTMTEGRPNLVTQNTVPHAVVIF